MSPAREREPMTLCEKNAIILRFLQYLCRKINYTGIDKVDDAVRAEIGVARSDPRHSDRTYRKLPKYASGAPSFRVSEGR